RLQEEPRHLPFLVERHLHVQLQPRERARHEHRTPTLLHPGALLLLERPHGAHDRPPRLLELLLAQPLLHRGVEILPRPGEVLLPQRRPQRLRLALPGGGLALPPRPPQGRQCRQHRRHPRAVSLHASPPRPERRGLPPVFPRAPAACTKPASKPP